MRPSTTWGALENIAEVLRNAHDGDKINLIEALVDSLGEVPRYKWEDEVGDYKDGVNNIDLCMDRRKKEIANKLFGKLITEEPFSGRVTPPPPKKARRG